MSHFTSDKLSMTKRYEIFIFHKSGIGSEETMKHSEIPFSRIFLPILKQFTAYYWSCSASSNETQMAAIKAKSTPGAHVT